MSNPFRYKYITINIERTLEERLLGVIFDEQLNFTPHIDHLVNRSFAAINKIRDFSMQHLGLPTKLSTLLYICNIRSIIESSYMCWSIVNEDQLKRLETIQGTMIKMILRVKGQYSFNTLNVEAGMLLLLLLIDARLASL